MKTYLALGALIFCAITGQSAGTEPILCTLETLAQHGLILNATHEPEPEPPGSATTLRMGFHVAYSDKAADELKIWITIFEGGVETLRAELRTIADLSENSRGIYGDFLISKSLLPKARLRLYHKRGFDPNVYEVPASLLLSAPRLQ